ncbi:MAG: isoprenyl transferase [Clostridiales bacterium]|nr:isoprenyl transferase [Clostridiales bacterium]
MRGVIDGAALPKHVAIIMDGNGRWAQRRFLNRKAGHAAGAEALKKLTREAEKLGIEYMTVYAFSTENWKRSREEVNDIMDLIRKYIQQYIDDSENNQARVFVIGRRDRVPEDIVRKIENLERVTEDKQGIKLIIALDYGGRDEMIRAVKKLCSRAKDEEITESLFESFLDTSRFPDPELLIRTSGETRVSNFLLWQLAYAEFHFTDKLWPDFNINDLKDAIRRFQDRERRFGGR